MRPLSTNNNNNNNNNNTRSSCAKNSGASLEQKWLMRPVPQIVARVLEQKRLVVSEVQVTKLATIRQKTTRRMRSGDGSLDHRTLRQRSSMAAKVHQ